LTDNYRTTKAIDRSGGKNWVTKVNEAAVTAIKMIDHKERFEKKA